MTTPPSPTPLGEVSITLKLKPHYPDEFKPIGVSFVGLSRVGPDIQMDLGQINLKRVTEQVAELRSTGRVVKELTVDMSVGVSAYLTPAAFLKLHQEVNRFYGEMKASGQIADDVQAEAQKA